MDVGRSLLVSILDLEGVNPLTRLLRNNEETMEQALLRLRESLTEGGSRKKLPLIKKNSKFKPDFQMVVSSKEATPL